MAPSFPLQDQVLKGKLQNTPNIPISKGFGALVEEKTKSHRKRVHCPYEPGSDEEKRIEDRIPFPYLMKQTCNSNFKEPKETN